MPLTNELMENVNKALTARDYNPLVDEAGNEREWRSEGKEDIMCLSPNDIRKIIDALKFYANPESYHGVAIIADPPCGDFGGDFSLDHNHPDYEWPMAGALARKVLKQIEMEY